MKTEELLAEIEKLDAEGLQRVVAKLGRGVATADSPRGIEKTPGVCGGSARIVRTRIPVWTLVQYKRMGTSDMELLQQFPTLIADDLQNAWAYADSHFDEIDRDLQENEA